MYMICGFLVCCSNTNCFWFEGPSSLINTLFSYHTPWDLPHMQNPLHQLASPYSIPLNSSLFPHPHGVIGCLPPQAKPLHCHPLGLHQNSYRLHELSILLTTRSYPFSKNLACPPMWWFAESIRSALVNNCRGILPAVVLQIGLPPESPFHINVLPCHQETCRRKTSPAVTIPTRSATPFPFSSRLSPRSSDERPP